MRQMERFDWMKIIKLNFLTLKIIGLWPSDDGLYGRNLYTFYSVITILLFHVGHVLSQTVNLYFIKDDLQAVTGTVFILLMEMLAMLKAYSLTKNMRMLKKLIATLNKRLFQPKNSQQIKLIQSNINAWKAISSTFWFLAVGWLFFYSCFPILDKTFQEYRLPFLAWYPYNTNTSPQYEVTYLYQVVAISYLCMINVNIDGLIAALNMFIGSQFDILSHDLKNLHDITQGISKNVNKKLLNCIEHHKEILKFANNANRFYNWLIFVEFFVGGVSIGLSMFQLTLVVPFSSEFYSFVSYTNCITVQVFMYCWFGNEIEIKSNNLPYAVFESDWTGFSPEVKKNLIIFVSRVQRSLQISALGLFYLSLETFGKILKTSWSYFALLRQVNSRK